MHIYCCVVHSIFTLNCSQILYINVHQTGCINDQKSTYSVLRMPHILQFVTFTLIQPITFSDRMCSRLLNNTMPLMSCNPHWMAWKCQKQDQETFLIHFRLTFISFKSPCQCEYDMDNGKIPQIVSYRIVAVCDATTHDQLQVCFIKLTYWLTSSARRLHVRQVDHSAC